MKLSKDEIIRKLAEAIKDNCFQPVGIRYCRFCNRIVSKVNNNHDSDCPVLLAEEVLKEISTCEYCNGTGWEDMSEPYSFYCKKCDGTGINK